MKKNVIGLLSLLFITSGLLGACDKTSESILTQSENLVLSLTQNTIHVGETAQVSVKAGDQTIADAIFESSDTSVATIDDKGLVTALKAGKTTLKAKKAGYIAGTIELTVIEREKEQATLTLEFEDASHYTPNGLWGDAYSGFTHESPIEENENSSGKKSVGYQVQGCKETFAFTSDKAGKVRIGFVMASTLGDYSQYPNVKISEMSLKDTIKITVNGTALDLGTLTLPGSDEMNYYNFQEVQLSDVQVQQGENKIVVETIGTQGPNLDCVNIYAEGFTLESKTIETVKPESIGTYDYYVNGYEWGPGVNRIVLNLPGDVLLSSLSSDLFTVRVGATQRQVENIYLVDENGDKSETLTSGSHVGLDLEINFTSTYVDYGGFWQGYQTNDNGCSPFTYDMTTQKNRWNENYAYNITLSDSKSLTIGETTYDSDSKPFEIKTLGEKIIEAVRNWTEAKSHTYSQDETKTLTYKAFEKEELKNDGGKNPLIIWLHGQGEGGTDPDIALLGNQVTQLGEGTIQSYFTSETSNGAYALAVQTSTMWMDDGNGSNNQGLAHSIYTEALKETIDTYIASNSDIDTSRIYLGGCSNGGYMTLEMAINYGSTGFFKGYFPVCEAYADSFISEADIDILKELNIWFTAAQTDMTVDPTAFTAKTYARLKTAGAQNVHFSYFEKVVGNDSGHENEYDGHWSWIYLFHDEIKKDQADHTAISAPSTADVLVNSKAVGIWEWLSLLA